MAASVAGVWSMAGFPPGSGVLPGPDLTTDRARLDILELGRLPRPGLPRHDHHLVVPDRLGDLGAPLADRQLRRIGDGTSSHTAQDREGGESGSPRTRASFR